MTIHHARAGAALGVSLTCLMMAGSWGPGVEREANPPAQPAEAVTIYDPQPDHLWNRLHQALFVRTTPEGKTLGHDEVNPLLWPRTKHLLTGRSHEDALRLLDELLKQEDKQIRDPLKRAVLQHDLGTVFTWTAHPYGHLDGTEEHTTTRRALQRRLVPAIHRLALTEATIASLPDNYAAAVKSKAFAPKYDPEHPDRPFLPEDLFDPEGPWVCVSTPINGPPPLALAHTHFFSGRSVFLVFLRLPDGRKATLAYLDKLNNVPSPWALRPRKPNETPRRDLLELSPDLPQFPVGTQVALVRQMVLITDAGKLAASPVTESVQLRVYRKVRRVGDERQEAVQDSQSFVEFALRRSDLFADKAGGLHSVSTEQQAYLTLHFLTGSHDPFEPAAEKRPSHLMPVLKTCAACHSESGIYSVHSFTRRFSASHGRRMDLALWPGSVKAEREKVLEWKQRQYDWGLLQGLWPR